jgi:hypothetical protein
MVGPIPVKLTINGALATTADIEQLVFDPATIPFARLAQAARDAINRSKLTNGRVMQWGSDGPDKKIFMIVLTQSDRRTVLLDHQLHVVRVMQQ